ncbi:MAG TPA: M43 family zinc metalloprotease [Bacteroidia bacterium]|nr:M43 family zinc metalloprotease [Bacteroidia bacterium]
MKQLIIRLCALITAVLPLATFAQTTEPQHDKCLTEILYRERIITHPEYAEAQAQLERETEAYVPQYMAAHQPGANHRSASVVRIIPVVFHVIHEGGAENISMAQIQDQIDILNQDYRRQNADTVNTPSVFQSLSGDSEIEFRLATKDPNGNCTDGVVRVYSSLTNNARDEVKAVSYWPSNMYLNIWVVKSIRNVNGTPGTVIGFAQFPGGGPANTDGVVVVHSFTGSIGTAASSGGAGRTATHEVGHWLNLRHIWGDDNGACTGSDFVADTPNQADMNFSTCPNWPKISCSNGPDGEMFTNYMDYTQGNCQNQFSIGQAARMNAALSSSTSGRNNLWTPANLFATGTDGTPPSLCAPIAAFPDNVRYICEGTTINFTDGSYNGIVDTYTWDFPGGTPSTSSVQNPSIQYNTAGVYDVTLTTSNATGSSSVTHNGIIIVEPAIGVNGVPYYESFENISFPGNDWIISNDNGNTWEQNTLAAKTGANSIYINNYSGNPNGAVDVFVTPTYNLSWVTAANMTFELADAIRATTSTDNLRVFVSVSCGQLWAQRYNKSGANLATAGLISSPFFPNANQWRTESVSLSSSSYWNQPNVRFKFEYTQNTGNNIFIDDINLSGTVGVNEVLEQSLDLEVYPNPAASQATVSFTITGKMDVAVDVIDMLGKTVNNIAAANLEAGDYQFELPAGLAPGIYSVRVSAGGYPVTKKIVIY